MISGSFEKGSGFLLMRPRSFDVSFQKGSLLWSCLMFGAIRGFIFNFFLGGLSEGSGSVAGKAFIKEFSSLAVVTGYSEDKPRGSRSKPLGFGFSPGGLTF
jgi:hypothetical protein